LLDRGRGLDSSELLSLRQSEATGVWQRMRDVLDAEQVATLLPKESLSQAIGYLNNHWSALQLYVSDALIPIDNNETEQLMKQVAVGRKNWPGTDAKRWSRQRVGRRADERSADAGEQCVAERPACVVVRERSSGRPAVWRDELRSSSSGSVGEF
jgi:hypothetical protein